MSTTAKTRLLDSRATKKNQPALRLVVSREDDPPALPRKYDQSTSGRVSSTGTAPPLSRSSAIAVDSAIRSFVDKTFRKYPSEVPERLAYPSWASRFRDFKYDRSDSNAMRDRLPDSNVSAIPFGRLPPNAGQYHGEMTPSELRQLRKRRLKKLLDEEYGGIQKDLAKILDVEPNYISQLLTSSKSFGETAARRFETKARKPHGWFDIVDDTPPPAAVPSATVDWPFSFDRSYWDRLSPSQQREIESSFLKLVLGASVQDMASPSNRKKTV